MDTALVILFVILLFVNIPVYKFYFSKIFRDSDDFNESIKYSFRPDLFSLFKGEYFKDQIAEFKLGIFIFACIFTVVIEFLAIKTIAERLF